MAGIGQLLERGQSWQLRHRDVEEQDVGMELVDEREGFFAVGSLADNLKARLGLEQFSQAIPEDGMVVRDQNAD